MLRTRLMTIAICALMIEVAMASDDPKVKLSECPEAVQKTFQAESSGSKIEMVTKEKDQDDEVIYWADAVVNGKTYAIGILENGTLSEMNLVNDGDAEIPLERSPAAVQATFKSESFGLKIATVTKDLRYGVTTYQAVIEHKGKSYDIVVAEDGTLIEKILVIDDEEVELTACPAMVQAAFKKQAKGGTFHGITRTTGIGKPTYEAEVEIQDKVYLIEVTDTGSLISKTLQAAKE